MSGEDIRERLAAMERLGYDAPWYVQCSRSPLHASHSAPLMKFGRLRDAGLDPRTAPFSTGIVHGPYPPCNVPGCPEPAYHLHGKRCAAHAFSPQLSGGARPWSAGACGFEG
jgi:hypothetical protein